VRSGSSLFGEDQLVAASHKEPVALAAMLNDQLPAAAEKLLARHNLRFGVSGRSRFGIGWR
jgi:hypothetical protein